MAVEPLAIETAAMPRPPEWPLVGRDGELLRMRAALERSDLAGLLLAGEPGVGKTRLANEGLVLGAQLGFRCERIMATAATRAVPLGGLAPLLPPATVSSELRGDLLAGVVRSLASQGEPLLLIVDDAHLLDSASAEVVHQLARRDGNAIIVTVRTGELPPDPLLALWKEAVLDRIDLAPFGREDVDLLLDTALDGPIDGAARRDLWDASQGNALFLRELVVGALDAGILDQHDGIWRLGPLAGAPRLVDLIEARLGDLTEAERDVLDVLAVGEPLDLDVLGALDFDDGLLGRLESQGLVQVSLEEAGPRARLDHPLQGEVLRERMTPLDRRAISRRLAGTTRRTGSPIDILRTATWRLEGGGTDDPDEMLTAARQAYFAQDDRLAELLARAAVEGGAGVSASLLLAQVVGKANRHREGDVLLEAILSRPDLTDEQVALAAMQRAVGLFWGLGLGADARAVLRSGERRLPPGAWRDELTAQRATLELLEGELDEALATAGEALEADPCGRAGVTAAIAVAPALAVQGRCDDAIAVAERAFAAHQELGDLEVMSNAGIHLVAQVLALTESGRLAEAEAVGAGGYDASVAEHDRDGQAWFAMLRGRVALVGGRLVVADTWFREGAAAFADLGQPGPRRWCLAGSMLAAAQRGDEGEAAVAQFALDAIGPTPMQLMEPEVLRARGWVACLRGEADDGRRQVRAAASLAETSGATALAVLAWHDIARIGHPSDATGALGRAAALVDGELASARADHAAAMVSPAPDAMASVSERFEALGAILLAAEAAAGACNRYRRAGQVRAAEGSAVRARALAGRCEGAATPALALTGPVARLTPRELEVASLVATGMASKAVARDLGLSTRTVESHLQRAFVKLGVSHRADLDTALALAQDL